MGADSFGNCGEALEDRAALVRQRKLDRAFRILFLFLSTASPTFASAVNVLTQHNDSFRTGANLSESVLTTSNVNTNQFGKLFSRAVDGQIYAQPLYVSGLTISNQLHNVVYVVTEHDSVYAFDADDPTASNALWHVSLGTSVPIADINGCTDLQPEIGITGTPVIDLTSSTMYLVAKIKAGTNHFQQLHALDLITGQDKFGGPVSIQGSVPGTGTGSVGGTLTFDPLFQHSRASLLLLSNTVYVAFGSHCDYGNYHGWLFGYNATNLQQTAVFCTTPNAGSDGGGGGIWGSGTGPAADANGNIYVSTGNGALDKNTGGLDFGDSVIKLSTSNGTLAVADWFSPHDQVNMYTNDLDLGAGGPVWIPSANLIVLVGKTGELYLINPQHLGGFVNFSSDTNIVQEFSAASNPYSIGQALVYWNGPTNQFLFLWAKTIPLSAYSFNGATIATTPAAVGSTVQNAGRAGGISLSSNGNTPGSGILWGTEAGSGGTVHAYDATNVGHELWNSQQLAARDALGNYTKFCAPTIANGKVYVPTTSSNLVVYGLLGTPSLGVSPTSYDFGTVATGTTTQAIFLVTNSGGALLSGTATVGGTPFAIASGSPFNIASIGSTNVVVSFTPSSAGSFTNQVIFASNGGGTTNAVTGAGAIVPTPSFSGTPVAGLVPLTVTFTDTSTGTITNRSWNFGDGGTTNTLKTTVSYTYIGTGVFTVALSDFGPVGGTQTSTRMNYIVVTNVPAQLVVSPAIHNYGAVLVGQGSTQSFSVVNSGLTLLSGTASAGGSPFSVIGGTPYNLPGGQTGTVSVAFNPVAAGNFTNSVIFASNGGNSTNTVIGSGATAPSASFNGTPTAGLAPLAVIFTDSSTGTITNRSWVFGDGGSTNTLNTTVDYTYDAAGTDSVTLVVAGPLGVSTNTHVNYIVVTNGSPRLVVMPVNRDFGLLPVGQSSTQTFALANAGLQTLSGTATVSGAPFGLVGGSPYTLNSAQTGLVSVSFSPVAAGAFTSSVLFVSNGGISTNALTGSAAIAPTAGFSGTPTNGAAPLLVNFADASSGTITGRLWTFGDGGISTLTSPNHSYSNAGNFSVSLTVSGPLGSNTLLLANYVTVTNVAPLAAFVANPTNGAATLVVNFTDASTGSVTSRMWNFGDAGASTLASPSHSYTTAGTFSVSLSVSGPYGSNTVTLSNCITVTNLAGAPIAAFIANPTNGTAPLLVNFTDASSGTITNHFWVFGDGATSAVTSPSHTYSNAGAYSVSLTVLGPGGSSLTNLVNLIGVTNVLNTPPTVVIVRPADGMSYPSASNLTITIVTSATANDGAAINKIEFFSDGTKLGETSSNPGTNLWANPALGPHVITGRATDTLGLTNTSPATTITVGDKNSPLGDWEVTIDGADKGAQFLSFEDDFSASGFGIRLKKFGLDEIWGHWGFSSKGEVTGPFVEQTDGVTNWTGTLLGPAHSLKSIEAVVPATVQGTFHWKGIPTTTFPDLGGTWTGLVTVARATPVATSYIFNANTNDFAVFDITTTDTPDTVVGQLLVTSRNKVYGYLTFDGNPVTVSGAFSTTRHSLALSGTDATAEKISIKIFQQTP